MQKLIKWCSERFLGLSALFLLVFIPLYPKLPLIDIKNTWVYIRAEDFAVLFILGIFIGALARKKVTLTTPITVPIFLFWLMGGIATMHGMLLIFPTIAGVFANVALLSFVRRIEYMSMFFVAYSAMRGKTTVDQVVTVLAATVAAVSVYGIGQKYMGFPAYLTMNEEFAKGIPLTLSALSRVSSTFGGHYDLAAYLVLALPILASMVFAYKNRGVQVLLLGIIGVGMLVLLMTVSRISLVAVLVSFTLVLFFHNRKLLFQLLPVAVIAGVLFLRASPRVIERFTSTIKATDVVVDAHTGESIGHIKEVPSTYFEDKEVWQRFYVSLSDIHTDASPSASVRVYSESLPSSVLLLTAPSPTGEDLPAGTGYINLTLSPVIRKLDNFLYEPPKQSASESAKVFFINGDYLLKKAFAYDLSFTTRFQGEWPNAIAAFKRNVLFGSGYGSVSLAVDNSYLRMLAEVGGLGFVSFLVIFLLAGGYVSFVWNSIESRTARQFLLGAIAGMTGILINAAFIDVFEASKVAFVLWLIIGFSLGLANRFTRKKFDAVASLFRIAKSPVALCIYLLVAVVLLFSQMTRNYFVGDDYTWFRWAADCAGHTCGFSWKTFVYVLTHSDGFFYRPGTKLFFSFMYAQYWLNQTVYHAVSIGLHYVASVLVFFLGQKILKRRSLAFASALFFVAFSGFSEAVFWISSVGLLFAGAGMLAALLSYIKWQETKRGVYVVLSVVATLSAAAFHEVGVVTPLLFVLYSVYYSDEGFYPSAKRYTGVWILFAATSVVYLLARLSAGSHWFSGDYNYNLVKFPLNAIGNLFGYTLSMLFGTYASSAYTTLRAVLRTHIAFSLIVFGLSAAAALYSGSRLMRVLTKQDRTLILFSFGFVLIALLPFLGLGNIAPRYGYIASVGMAYLLVYAITRVYELLRTSGRAEAVTGTFVVVVMFFMLQIVGIDQQHKDWYEAGEKARKFFVSMDGQYEEYWKSERMEFYFVNVPIRHRSAWVFPVGLSDAMWFVFPKTDTVVNITPTVEDALNLVEAESKRQRVYVFEDNGSVRYVPKEVPEE